MSMRTAEREAGGAGLLADWLPGEPVKSTYAMGYGEVFLELLQRRSAEENAAHPLPMLEPGMEVLDLGCGPGSITTGLAEAVFPGTVTALDSDPSQLEMADGEAARCGALNIQTRLGNGLDLPFGESSFDAVHCHGFLMHSPDVRRQLEEIRKVLRPGGIISAREMDITSSFISPAAHGAEIFAMLAQVVRRAGGDPLRGRHLKALLVAAGLGEVRAGHSADFFDSREETEFLACFLTEWGLSREFIRSTGHTGGDRARWEDQVRRWRDSPGAVGCFHFGHATGRKPR